MATLGWTSETSIVNRCYRRHNYNRLAMEHYETRDSFRRATNPDLRVISTLPNASAARARLRSRR